MSQYIGDKSRFNRLRKQKLLKRRKKAELVAARAAAPAVGTPTVQVSAPQAS